MSPPIGRVEHLGGDVVQRAQDRPIGDRVAFAGAASKTQVDQRGMAARRNDHVAGLHVAVHPAGLVQGRQGFGHLPGDPDGHGQIERRPCVRVVRPATALRETAWRPSTAERSSPAARIGTRCGWATRRPTCSLAGQNRQSARVILPLGPQHFHGIAGRMRLGAASRTRLVQARHQAFANESEQFPRANAAGETCDRASARNASGADPAGLGRGSHEVGARGAERARKQGATD